MTRLKSQILMNVLLRVSVPKNCFSAAAFLDRKLGINWVRDWQSVLTWFRDETPRVGLRRAKALAATQHSARALTEPGRTAVNDLLASSEPDGRDNDSANVPRRGADAEGCLRNLSLGKRYLGIIQLSNDHVIVH